MAELIQGTLSFATEGEQKAAKCLRSLPDQWIVVCNKILPTSNGRSFEIDFIIIANNWVFLLDEKAWRGPIRGSEDYWVRTDGSSEKSPLAKIDYVARIVKGRLDWRLSLLKHEGYFVRGGVLFSSQTALPQIHDTRARDGLFLLDTVCERLQQLDQHAGTPLIGQYRREVTRAFIGFDDRPKIPKQIDNYIIKESVIQRPNVRVMRAVENGEEGVQRQLIVYNCGQDPLEASSLRNFYMQECKALRKLNSTGLVPQVQDPRSWSDDFLVLPIELPSGESLNAYPLPETSAEFQQELVLVKSCFQALHRIHSQGVLHRALGPDAIYVQSNVQRSQAPKVTFTNFYAARLGIQTISAALDELEIEDPYASEELIAGYGAATERTDTFSLALVLLQRLSAVSINDIRASIDSNIVFPDHPRWSEFLSMERANELAQLFKEVLIPAQDETPPDTQQIAQRVDALMQHMQSSTRVVEGQALMKGRFRVHRLLGEGAMARTYLVSMSAYEGLGLHVLKQFIRPSDVQQQAFDEYRALQTMKSIYFPTIEDIYLPEDDAHIKMEYIPGPTLQQTEGELPWPLDRWWTFARHLLSALEQLEDRHLLHRDIKPANIILHEQDHHPVLIDFGFAVQRGTTTRVAGTPLYLPPEALIAKEPPPSCDRYAVGVVLFKTLTGLIPFKNMGSKRQLVDIEQISDEKVRRIAAIILRALASDAQRRPESAHEMYEELQRGMLALEAPLTAVAAQQELPLQEQHNPWVDGIRSVYRNSETGNMDNRGLDSEFVKSTYVQTALDLSLLPAIIERKPKVIFLAGNPGDGKTAFLAKVQAALQARGAARIDEHCNSSGWECIYQGHIFRSCYDASESFAGMSADEQLIEKLRGLEGHPSSNVNLTVLVAINDGRLLSFLAQQAGRFPWLVQEQEQASRANDLYATPVWSIDLKKRAFVSMPDKEHSLFRQVLQRFVDAPHWELCQKCVAKTICPILSNATELRQARRQNRLEYLFLYTHLRQQRHITMRDLRSTLAYLITANKSCEQVHEARRGEDRGASLLTQSYWQFAFSHVPEGDELLADIASLDPARFPQPHLDRFLHFHQQSSENGLRQQLFADNVDLPMQRFVSEREWIDAFKRRLYFAIRKMNRQDGSSTNPTLPRLRWSDLLPYQYAIAYVGLLDGREDPAYYLQQLALGILRAQKVTSDVPRLRDALNVVVQSSDTQQLFVLKQLPLTDFELQVIDVPRQSVVETLPQGLRLLHRQRGVPRLDIHLDLFELLMRLAHGFLPNAPEYQSLLNDLEPFKGALLLQEANDLVLIENQYRVHHITQANGKIVRTVLS